MADANSMPTNDGKPFYIKVLSGCTIVWIVLDVPRAFNADVGVLWGCWLVPVIGVWLITWLTALCIYLDRYVDSPKPNNPRVVKAWCISTLAVIVSCLFHIYPVGFTARTWASSAALEKFVQNPPPPGFRFDEVAFCNRDLGWVGLFRVDGYMAHTNGAVAIYTCESRLGGHGGLLYLPPGTPNPFGLDVDGHLYGPWHYFSRHGGT